jgi:Lar family restriction alleviation protein
MSEILKPCPFCGGEAERHTIGDEEPTNRGGDVICCPDCGASSHVEFGRKENIVGLWNQRADLAAFLPMEEWDARDEAVLLMVDYTEGDHAIDDATIAITIGHNNDHNVGADEAQGWLFAGWCWSHDHYVQGKGTPIGWMPIPHHLARAREDAP